mgnify:FL=1
MNSVKLHPKYEPLLMGSHNRYSIVTGGRGSGKSYGLTVFLLLLSMESDHVILFTRYTMTSAQISIIPEFLEKIELLGLESMFHVTKTEIINKQSGSKILFRGIKTSSGDQTANLKSIQGVTTFVIEEAEELVDESIFDKIDLSVRSTKRDNRSIIVMNPTTKEHWIYKRFFESKGVRSGSNGSINGTNYIHTTYLDNLSNLSQGVIDTMEQMKLNDVENYNNVVLGGWRAKAEGVVFTNWRFGEFNPDGLQVTYGQDYGFKNDANTLVGVAIDKSKKLIYIKEHLYKTGLNTHDLYVINNKVCGRDLIVADSAEPRLISELSSKGNNIRACKKGPGSISAGVSILQSYELVLESNSKNIATELNNYAYADKGSNLFIDDYNHALDALRYITSFHLMGSSRIEVR